MLKRAEKIIDNENGFAYTLSFAKQLSYKFVWYYNWLSSIGHYSLILIAEVFIVANKNFKVERIYNMTDTFKELYTQEQNGKIFNNLYNLITCENNILSVIKKCR